MEISVCIVTYNHEKYIENCIKSVLNQSTNFEFEVIIGDDYSQDGTRDIIERLKWDYPGKIKTIFHEKNLGPWGNFYETHNQAKGKYIAHLDGDDYFLPGKLQAQYNFMESNLECNISWHRMYSLKDGTLTSDKINANAFPRITQDLLLSLVTVGSNSSKMYRNGSLNFVQPSFPVLDYFANYKQIDNGYASFIGNEILGVYRLESGISKSNNTKKLICSTMIFIVRHDTDKKLYVNTAALYLFLVDIKNKRLFAFKYFIVFLKTFHFYSFLQLLKNINYYKKLKY